MHAMRRVSDGASTEDGQKNVDLDVSIGIEKLVFLFNYVCSFCDSLCRWSVVLHVIAIKIYLLIVYIVRTNVPLNVLTRTLKVKFFFKRQ